MRAIIPVLAVFSLLLSACDFIPSQEEATETALAIRSTVTAEAAAAQTEEASAAATAEAAAAPPEEPEEEADSGTESEETSNGDAVTIVASNGCEITFFGPFEARRGDDFIVEWRVVCGGDPGVGTFFATLGNPPSSANATHASGELGAGGNITLTLEVNWDTGETTLLCSYEGEVYEVTQITILESG